MSKQRRIVCAALRFADGLIVCGARHYDLGMHGIIPRLMNVSLPVEQGFVDQYGVFLNRVDALIVAENADQVRHKSGNPNSRELFSEDLY